MIKDIFKDCDIVMVRIDDTAVKFIGTAITEENITGIVYNIMKTLAGQDNSISISENDIAFLIYPQEERPCFLFNKENKIISEFFKKISQK